MSTTYHSRTDSNIPAEQPRYTLYGTNLTDEDLGARVIFATDEFFAGTRDRKGVFFISVLIVIFFS